METAPNSIILTKRGRTLEVRGNNNSYKGYNPFKLEYKFDEDASMGGKPITYLKVNDDVWVDENNPDAQGALAVIDLEVSIPGVLADGRSEDWEILRERLYQL